MARPRNSVLNLLVSQLLRREEDEILIFFNAVANNQKGKVLRFLNAGFHPNTRIRKNHGEGKKLDSGMALIAGMTAMHCAAINGHDSMIEILRRRGGDLEIADKLDFTPLLYAVQNQQDLTAAVLWRLGASVHARTSTGKNILHLAVEQNREEKSAFHFLEIILTWLTHALIDINAMDQDKNTALLLAAFYNRTSTVRWLLKEERKIMRIK